MGAVVIMARYPLNHYDKPATYIVATVPERGQTIYELVHYEDHLLDHSSTTLRPLLDVANRMELPVADRVYFPHTNRWVRIDRLLYLEQLSPGYNAMRQTTN